MFVIFNKRPRHYNTIITQVVSTVTDNAQYSITPFPDHVHLTNGVVYTRSARLQHVLGNNY